MKKSIFAFVAAFSLLLLPAAVFAADADWKELKTEVSREFTDINCPEPRICYLTTGLYSIGGSGTIIKTTDGGDTFTSLSIPSSNPLHAISCASASTCYAVGDFGTLLITTDGGKAWTEATLGSRASPPHLTGVFAVDEKNAIFIGKDGFMLRTTDGGTTITPPSVRTLADLYDIFFTGLSRGFIVGNGGAYLTTTDGGESWSANGGLMEAGALTGISGNSTMLYAAGDAPFASTDAGGTWTKQSAGMGTGFRAVAPAGTKTAYLISDGNIIYQTTDGGAKWNAHFSPSSAIVRDVVCPTESYCIATGSYGKAFRFGTPPPPPPPPAPAPDPAPVAVATTSAVSQLASPAAAATSPVVPTPTPVVEAPKPPAATTVPAASGVPTLTRTLKKGASGEEVKSLQKLLAGVAGIYPSGEITGYFGPATEKAVGEFQRRYSLAGPGEAGYGQAGPKTRAKLVEVFKSPEKAPVSVSQAQTTSPTFTRTLKKGMRGKDVTELQTLLARDKEVYPEGEISGYFGGATAQAVGRYQEKNGIVKQGEPGYGEVGPKTRAKLSGSTQ